uniref:RdRp catalytic domain-containing protein n=1 Tax=Trichuris muris TaxID=70415 RepID=A0A5S6QMC9_TRIMR
MIQATQYDYLCARIEALHRDAEAQRLVQDSLKRVSEKVENEMFTIRNDIKQGIEIEDDVLELYAWGDCLLMEKKNEAYNVIKFSEPLCMSILLKKTDRCGLSEPFVCGNHAAYVEAGGSTESLSRLLTVLDKMSPSMLSEIFGLYRMWGHPVVDEVAGCEKVQSVGKRTITMDHGTLKLLYACLIKEFCINYI